MIAAARAANAHDFILAKEDGYDTVIGERGVQRLDPASRALAEEELARRYLAPRIVRVLRSIVNFGSRYWDVETDRGIRRFIMKDPNKNVFWVTDDHLVLRDTLGNRYEIVSLRALDEASRAEIDRVM